ncbi:MAG: hypothetical protein SCARUB_05107, partial [Candidatus Scalindua rubra]
MRVLSIGRWPPPHGGVSVHIERLHRYLKLNHVHSVVVNQSVRNNAADYSDKNVINLMGTKFQKFKQLRAFLAHYDADIVHFHTSLFRDFIPGGFFLVSKIKNAQKVVTIHSGGFVSYYHSTNPIWKLLARRMLGKFDHIIALNENQASFYKKEVGVDTNSISLIPSFLSPIDNFHEKLDDKLNEAIQDLKLRADYVLLISGRVFDFYGFDLLIESADEIMRKESKKIGIIFVFYTAQDDEYRQQLEKKITAYKHVLILEDLTPETFFQVMKQSDVYVRPTTVDSYGVTVPEALSNS